MEQFSKYECKNYIYEYALTQDYHNTFWSRFHCSDSDTLPSTGFFLSCSLLRCWNFHWFCISPCNKITNVTEDNSIWSSSKYNCHCCLWCYVLPYVNFCSCKCILDSSYIIVLLGNIFDIPNSKLQGAESLMVKEEKSYQVSKTFHIHSIMLWNDTKFNILCQHRNMAIWHFKA